MQPEKNAQPLLSVVITIKNDEQTLPVALDSLLIQETDFSFEVIVTDGCSEDRSLEVIRNHPLSSRVPMIIHPLPAERHGMTVGSNVAAGLARGEYLLFMQVDTRVRDPRAVQKAVDAMREPGVVGTYYVGTGAGTDFCRYDFWGQVFLAQYQTSRVERDFDTKFNCVRRDVFERLGGFNESAWSLGGADFEFEMRLRREGEIAGVDVVGEHLHGFGKRHSPMGLVKKYCRNAEVAGATWWYKWRHRREQKGLTGWLLQRIAVCFACLASLIPIGWPWSLLAVAALALLWHRQVFGLVSNWRLVCVPLFSVISLYFSAFFFFRGVILGRTMLTFDNKMN